MEDTLPGSENLTGPKGPNNNSQKRIGQISTTRPAREKIRILSAAEEEKVPVSQICRRFGISRKTFYQWRLRYYHAQAEKLKNPKFKILNALERRKRREDPGKIRPSASSGHFVSEIIELVKRNPSFSSCKVAEQVALSEFGVRKVFRRLGLETAEARRSFQKAYLALRPWVMLAFILEYLLGRAVVPEIPLIYPLLLVIPKKAKTFTFFAGLFGTVFLTLYKVTQVLFLSYASLGERIGLVLSEIALAFGLFFFLYSFKYYLSIALVLFSSRSVNGKSITGGNGYGSNVSDDSNHSNISNGNRYINGYGNGKGGIFGRFLKLGNGVNGLQNGNGFKNGFLNGKLNGLNGKINGFGNGFRFGSLTRRVSSVGGSASGGNGTQPDGFLSGNGIFRRFLNFRNGNGPAERGKGIFRRFLPFRNGHLNGINGFKNGNGLNGFPASGWSASGGKNGPTPGVGNGTLTPGVGGRGNLPKVSIHLPFYNEKRVAERILEACRNLTYPNFEVIVVDDSNDGTTDIIGKWGKRYGKWKRINEKGQDPEVWKLEISNISNHSNHSNDSNGNPKSLPPYTLNPRPYTLKLIKRYSRQGFKGGALREALKFTDQSSEFVVVFDADFIPFTDTIEQFLSYYHYLCGGLRNVPKSKIAAIQGYQWHILNKDENWITQGIRTEYAGSYVVERSGTELFGTLKQIAGSVYMIRKDLLDKFGWETSITEDFQLTLKLYSQGYKIIYTPYIQAPAEAPSTLKRLIRQRMRWAEGHTHQVKQKFSEVFFSPHLYFQEKLEFLYLSPYYLQSFFFLIGTLSWFASEIVFKTPLPFWTQTFGWALVVTNLLSLPFMNAIGLFLEGAEGKDYRGLPAFIFSTYLLVPFQAYASIKGLLEKKEGFWFRTPKTGMITISVARAHFARLLRIFMPRRYRPAEEGLKMAVGGWKVGFEVRGSRVDLRDKRFSFLPSTLQLQTLPSTFHPLTSRKRRFLGRVFLSLLLIISILLNVFSFSRPKNASAAQINLEQQINIIDREISTTSQTITPTNNSLGLVNYGSSEYTSPTVYFEALLKHGLYTSDSVGTNNSDRSLYCLSATDCKIAYYDTTDTSLRFMDCEDETCSVNTVVVLDGAPNCLLTNCSTTANVGQYPTLACPATDNCKVSYYDNTSGAQDLKFADCDSATCNVGSVVLLDGNTGCTLDNCSTTADVGSYDSLTCPSSANCKIAYRDFSTSDLKFADCGTEDCSTASAGDGSAVLLDGNTGCTLDNCSTTAAVGWYTSITCPSSTNCKISYWDSTNGDLKFADCGTEDCSTASAGDGSAVLLDGNTGCTLDSCSTTADVGRFTSITCSSSANCKISYQDFTDSDLKFADCGTEDCSTASAGDGSAVLLDGRTGCTLDSCSTTASVGAYSSIACPSSTNCKISYRDGSTFDLKFADCGTEDCSTASAGDGSAVLLDGNTGCTLDSCSTTANTGGYDSISCPSSTNCKISYMDSTNADLRFADCGTEDCSTASAGDGSTRTVDGNGGGSQEVGVDGSDRSLYCLSATDCKIAYYDFTDTSLRFMDCDDETCSSGTAVVLDGDPECLLTNCSTTLGMGRYPALFCPSSDNCKISYYDSGGGNLRFVDCDSATCNIGSVVLLDGASNCTLDNCSTTADVGLTSSIACPSSVNCKISYYDSTNGDLKFADCGTEDCSTASAGDGSAVLLDGNTGCTLDSCSTTVVVGQTPSIACPSSTNCKISYYDATNGDLKFADCGTEDCSTASAGDGSAVLLDGNTGCTLDNCSTTASVGAPSIACPSSVNCKISYRDASTNDLKFADCGTEDCSTASAGDGSAVLLDGNTGCTLDNCSTTASVGEYASITCPSSANCKISYRDFTNTDLKFADCGTEDCSTASAGDGSAVLLDGRTGCTLDNCSTTTASVGWYTSITCPSSANCKISYQDATGGDLKFADCGTEDCSTASAGDGSTRVVDNGDEFVWVHLASSGGSRVADGLVGRQSTPFYTRVRSPAISLSAGDYSIRLHTSDGSGVNSASVRAARLIIVQSNPSSLIDTQTQVEVGNAKNNFSNTTFSTLTDHKIYLYDSSKFSGTVNVYFEATLHTDTSTNTVSARLLQCNGASDCSGGTAVSGSQVDHTGDRLWTRKRTASAVTLTSGQNYAVQVQMSAGTGDIANAKIIIDQTDAGGLTDIELVHQYINTKTSDTDATYTAYDYDNRYDSENWSAGTFNYTFEATLKNNGGTSNARLTPGALGNVTGGVSYTRSRSASITPVDNTEYDTELANADVSTSWLIIQVSSLQIPEGLVWAIPLALLLPKVVPRLKLRALMIANRERIRLWRSE